MICLAALLLCAAVAVTADPFFYYSWDEEGEEIFFNQRYQSAGIARNAEMDTLILGTSMVSNFRASYLEQTFGGKAAKITIPDGRFEEFSQILDTVYRHHSPQRVLFSLDLNILVRDESELTNELPKYLYDRNPLNDVPYVLTGSGISEQLSTVTYKTTCNTTVTSYGDAYGNFVFKGSGNGHNVGMSQNGAKAMARQGFTYRDILAFYYTGTNVG